MEKETSTPSVYTLNMGVATDSIVTADAHTGVLSSMSLCLITCTTYYIPRFQLTNQRIVNKLMLFLVTTP